MNSPAKTQANDFNRYSSKRAVWYCVEINDWKTVTWLLINKKSSRVLTLNELLFCRTAQLQNHCVLEWTLSIRNTSTNSCSKEVVSSPLRARRKTKGSKPGACISMRLELWSLASKSQEKKKTGSGYDSMGCGVPVKLHFSALTNFFY